MEVSKKKNKKKTAFPALRLVRHGAPEHCGRASAVNILGLDDSGSVWKNSDI